MCLVAMTPCAYRTLSDNSIVTIEPCLLMPLSGSLNQTTQIEVEIIFVHCNDQKGDLHG